MTPKAKIAVTLPPELLKAAKSAVQRGRARNVSAYVADALSQKVTLDDLSSLLAEMLAETGGPLTRAERQAADRILRGTKKAR